MRRKWIVRIVLLFILALVLGAGYYAWHAFPAISGYNAKILCSCVFVEKRSEKEVKKMDLDIFPLTLASAKVNWQDSSVTASVFGLAGRKAIYRYGAGCTLVNDFDEKTIRSQRFNIPPVTNADSLDWPSGNHLPDTILQGINREKLREALDSAFLNRPEKEQTRAVVVVYRGQLVGERYAAGFDRNSLFRGWSMAKSITSALIGILVMQNKLHLDDPAPVPEWSSTGDPRHGITIRHLLQQTSGLDYREIYDKPSEATRMLFSEGDMAAFTARRPLRFTPGTVFNYSSGNSNILSRIIRKTVGEQNYTGFPYQALFRKIGMNSALLEPDASGTYVGSSYILATARDYARFGLLYYNKGTWKGNQILSPGWIKQTITAPPGSELANYGFQFWLNGFTEKDKTRRKFQDVPEDMFYADGFGGQGIYIIPSRDLVVVRLGLNVIDENTFLKRIINTVEYQDSTGKNVPK